MMKLHLVFFILTVLFSKAFGQSAKKINKQLRVELTSLQKRQDSLFVVFSKDKDSLKFVQDEMKQKIKTLLFSEDKKMRKIYPSISKPLETLEELGISTTDVFPDGSYFKSDPNYRKVLKELIETLDRVVVFDPVSTNGFNPDEYPLKEQNELLTTWIQTYEKFGKNNAKYVLLQQGYTERIKSDHPKVDSLFDVYQSLNTELERKAKLLDQRVFDAGENYRLNGPEGFQPIYRKFFPTFHSANDGELIVWDSEIGSTVDADPVSEHDPAIPVVAEPVVYKVVDEPALFPGGAVAMKRYLKENVNIPVSVSGGNDVLRNVYVRFVVSDQGEIFDVKILKGMPGCPDCEKDALRVIRAMPRWIPAKMNGKPVNSYVDIPVLFKK